MSRLEIPELEQGVTRVFSLSMTAEAARRLSGDVEAQAAALGLESVNETGVEVFALADLGELGLVGYLREGVDVPEADLQADRQKLSGLDGWVMLVHSSAFGGQGVVLTPWSEITLIGTYAQQQADQGDIALHSDAAQPYSGAPKKRSAKARRRRSRASLAVACLVVLAAGILWWALA